MTDTYLIPMSDSKTVVFDELMGQNPMLLKIVAGRNDTHATVLARPACHRNAAIRASVARNVSAPPVLLSALAKDKEYTVRYAVASNVSTPASTLRRIIENGGCGIVEVLKNPGSPLENILFRMLSKLPEAEKTALGFNARFSGLIRYAACKDAEVRPFLSTSDLEADEGSVEERWS